MDPFADGKDSRLQADVADLSSVVEENQVTHILALDILDRFAVDQVGQVLDQWKSRLRHKGKLTMSILDAQEVTRLYQQGQMTEEELSHLIFGRQRNQAEIKRSLLSAPMLAEMVQARDLKIVYSAYEHNRFVLVAERP